MKVMMGVDIGQRTEPTAICAVETEQRRSPDGLEDHFIVRFLERLPVGTSYPEGAARAAQIAESVSKRYRCDPYLYLDATGLGGPVVDLFRTKAKNAHVVAVYFTHGDRRSAGEDSEVILGKAYLVARLQTLLQTHRLHLPRTSEAEQLASDLLSYEIRVTEDANDRYGAFKVGAQDDLVTALGLAVQIDPPLPGIYFVPLGRPFRPGLTWALPPTGRLCGY